MHVIVEFTIATEDFLFGDALVTVEEMGIELEATVPTGNARTAYALLDGLEDASHG